MKSIHRTVTYVIPGEPIPLARPRMNDRRVYDSQKELKLVRGIYLRNQHEDLPLFSGPLELEITFHMGLPTAVTKRKQHAQRLDKYHTMKPDCDNLIKFFCDIANGVLYKDDCIIAHITAQKIWSNEPKTTCTIREITE